MASSKRCRRCRLPLQDIDARIDPQHVCLSCASKAEYPAVELWLKIAVHIAGFAALLAAPAVAALLTCLSDPLRLLP